MGNMRVKQAAHYVGLSKSLLDKMRGRGDGPAFLKVGAAVIYNTADLDTWLAGKRIAPRPANDNRRTEAVAA